jgi:hypothetical protein
MKLLDVGLLEEEEEYHENGSSMFIRNVCTYLPIHMALQPRIPTPISSSL